MKSDIQLREDVAAELAFDPRIESADVAVTAQDGIVSLSGSVDTYYEKLASEHAAKRVSGVRAVVNDLGILVVKHLRRSDQDIARIALDNLAWHVTLPDSLQVTVDRGLVTLSGTVDWNYQKDDAAAAVQNLAGVTGVANEIVVRTTVRPGDVEAEIRREFSRTATNDAYGITADTHADGNVVLSGNVHSWAEHAEAARAAWSVPGISAVDNRLLVTM